MMRILQLTPGLAVAVAITLGLGCAPDFRVRASGDAGGGGIGGGGHGGAGGGAEGGEPVWSQVFGGDGEQAAVAVAAAETGDLVVVGHLGGDGSFGDDTLSSAGSTDVFVAWLDADGAVTRTAQFGDANPQEVHAVTLASDGSVLLAGAMSGTIALGGQLWTSAGGRDGYVAKLSPNGAPLWGLHFGDAGYQAATAVALDVSGNVLVTGVFSGAVDLAGTLLESSGGYDALALKLGPDGTVLWSRKLGGSLDQQVSGIGTDGIGSVVLIGDFAGAISLDTDTLESAGQEDVFVAKLGAGGDVLWSRSFGDAESQVGRRIAVDADGSSVLGGDFRGSINFGGGPLAGSGVGGIFVAKMDSDGEHVWSKGFPGSGQSRLEGLALDAEGNVMIVGSLLGSLEFGGEVLLSQGADDVFAARLDSNGRVQWARRFGGVGVQRGLGVAMDRRGGVFVAGMFTDTMVFGSEPLASVGRGDAMILKVSP